MGVHRFVTGARVAWQGQVYAIISRQSPGTVTLRAVGDGAEQTVAEDVLRRALFDGDLRFVPTSRPGQQPSVGDGIPIERFLPWEAYPASLRAIAEHRLAVLEPLLSAGPPAWPRRLVEERVRTVRAGWDAAPASRPLHRAISVASVYRWRERYVSAGNDVRALVPATRRRGGKGHSRLAVVDDLVSAVINDQYFKRERVTIDDLLHEVARRIAETNAERPEAERLSVPSRATIGRRVAALDAQATFTAKHGQYAARRHFTQWGEATEPDRPLARVEIDHARIPVIVIDEHDNLPLGRPVLTYCLDVATRYPLGYYLGFEPFSYYAVMECLYHAIRPKESSRERYGCEQEWLAYGVPAVLVTDNGWELIGRDLRDASLTLGITLQQTPVRTPEFKGSIERSFSTLDTGLFTTLPGTTFANPRARGDYDSVDEACLSMRDLDRLLHLFIVDRYAMDRHAGLGGETPAHRWVTLSADPFAFLPYVPGSADDLKVLLGRVTQRTVQPYGIELEALRYNGAELAALRDRLKPGEKVTVKYHPGNLSRIHVLDPFAERYLEVPALARQYTEGLSLWKHRVLRAQVLAEQERVDLAGLGRAKHAMQQIVEQARDRKRTNARLARWTTGGAPFRDLEPPASGERAGRTPEESTTSNPADETGPADDELEALLATLSPEDAGWRLSFPSSGRAPERGPREEVEA
jgi:putative transposase